MAKSILITGCSSGLGEDAARTLHARGWRVFATCRKPEDVARLEAEGLESFLLDVADPDSIAAGMDEALRRTGGTLDALFNNAGYGLPGAMEDVPPGALREIFETNVFGLQDLTIRAVAVMRAQGRHGRIVQHSSALGRVPLRWRGAYTATKHAVEGLADTMRLELRDTDIHVSILNTGPVTSKFRINSIPGFEKWIDWENSAVAERYRAQLIRHLYEDTGKAPFQLDPPAVTAKLIHALEAPRPRARYFITTPTWIVEIARRILPQSVFDWLVAKA
ncbi:SDR family NAD(P)-dependent oxidoreductase [Roseobacter sp. HKCCD9010]|uniref:SDR family NAD(P)-dependent oxidoreductase n=1 Tax=unclassified Roseobacter TaxID=196798 RepID=UPI0014928FD6|nr:MULTISPECIES: SDR family NAD(P)-dependent oxidoreductase [unclassified Roseobacter]MBF9052514.1 SDR family NAD(P)-dependent oxidoreductase [Rhodobacterales bacterium HKCCD4356]NNV14449.1 SDR family NAD(P)-dependent oxidoreductase [Roseobacter sp. HKCCD7357]NNV18707.1 SDR family NAD(P)-dependent oxidoreductase [Roseobacter sp. HKCCD8768]NNV28170.1 SDR family NAD(P)-dependent oxidoreductase [Roseobacter sp. HKCCD8192]NNV32421.1 SDR family NAD(P)-dependent oxidoreductase [Roseobacter sp. HKCCD